MVECLKASGARRIAMSDSRLLDELHVADSLAAAGLSLKTWDQITLDEMYDFDAAVTDVTWAVAETGSLVISTHGGNGRALSLTPKIHVAIVRTEQILPDLVDLFEKLGSRSPRDYTVIISGPSKTADIEMNVVTGVHGPNVVQIYVID